MKVLYSIHVYKFSLNLENWMKMLVKSKLFTYSKHLISVTSQLFYSKNCIQTGGCRCCTITYSMQRKDETDSFYRSLSRSKILFSCCFLFPQSNQVVEIYNSVSDEWTLDLTLKAHTRVIR